MAISRPRSSGVPVLPLLLLLLLLLVPLIYSVSRLQLSWAPEGSLRLPPPAASKQPDHLMLGPAAGQGQPDCLQYQGADPLSGLVGAPAPPSATRPEYPLSTGVDFLA